MCTPPPESLTSGIYTRALAQQLNVPLNTFNIPACLQQGSTQQLHLRTQQPIVGLTQQAAAQALTNCLQQLARIAAIDPEQLKSIDQQAVASLGSLNLPTDKGFLTTITLPAEDCLTQLKSTNRNKDTFTRSKSNNT